MKANGWHLQFLAVTADRTSYFSVLQQYSSLFEAEPAGSQPFLVKHEMDWQWLKWFKQTQKRWLESILCHICQPQDWRFQHRPGRFGRVASQPLSHQICASADNFFCVPLASRRKFRSQTSDKMDRWKAETGRIREEKRRRKKIKKRKSPKKEEPGARKGRKVAEHCVFPMICNLWLRRVEK